MFAGEIKRLLKLLFGKFIGCTLDHDDLLAIADIDKIEIALLTLGVGGVDDKCTVHTTDTDCGAGAQCLALRCACLPGFTSQTRDANGTLVPDGRNCFDYGVPV